MPDLIASILSLIVASFQYVAVFLVGCLCGAVAMAFMVGGTRDTEPRWEDGGPLE